MRFIVCSLSVAASLALAGSETKPVYPGKTWTARDPNAVGSPRPTRLGVNQTRFTINGKSAFLYGISYYGALGASDEFIRRDLDDMQRHFVHGKSALGTAEAHRRAVETLVSVLKPWPNWYLDLGNERNIRDERFASSVDLKALRAGVRQLDPGRLVTASYGTDLSRDDPQNDFREGEVDFIAPHRPRQADSSETTAAKTREYLAWMKELGRMVPVHYREPFRRGYGDWAPKADDFVTDARAAKEGGAAGWCFHNGDQRSHPKGQPRRSFDLREQRLFDQLDDEERKAMGLPRAIFSPPPPVTR